MKAAKEWVSLARVKEETWHYNWGGGVEKKSTSLCLLDTMRVGPAINALPVDRGGHGW